MMDQKSAQTTVPSPQAVALSGVSVGYHGRAVVKGLCLDIGAGEMVGLLGPNGAGKTTLLRCLCGLCPPLAGTACLFGRPLELLGPTERARLVAVVPQEVETPMAFSVEEMVMIGRTASLSRWRPPGRDDRRIVERAMAYTDVVDLRARAFTELSGGEKQRVVVAMALAQEPRLVLLDEATSHLDINHRLEVMALVERLNREQGVTVILVSHDLNLAAEFCGRLLLMDDGRLVADGPPAEVLREETLRRVYRCEVRVQKHPADGTVTVRPAPRLAPGRSGQGIHVHVVAGGGSGEDVLRRLVLCEYTVTCGVLNEGDTDAEVAAALGIPAAIEKPFSEVGEAALAHARILASRADAVVVGPTPFGTGNLVNLSLAAAALQAGRTVFVADGVAERDYTPERTASAQAEELLAKGAVRYGSPSELASLLAVIPSGTPQQPEVAPCHKTA